MTLSHEGLSLLAVGGDLVPPSLLTREAALVVGAGALKAIGSLLVYSLCWWPLVVAPFVATWHVLDKAGRPGWTSLVPIYNWIQLLRVAGLPSWWLLVLCVPVVNVFAWFVACTRMARAFGKGRGYALGLALLPPVYMVALAVDDAPYRRLGGVERDVPLLVGVPQY